MATENGLHNTKALSTTGITPHKLHEKFLKLSILCIFLDQCIQFIVPTKFTLLVTYEC
jgi:hypothetical protein